MLRHRVACGLIGFVLSIAAVLLIAAPAPAAEDAGALAAIDEGGAGDGEPADAGDPAVESLVATAGRLRALADGGLAVDVAPQSLFDVSLDDEAALAVDRARLALLTRMAESDAGANRRARDAGSDATTAAPPELLAARLDVDRARLAFYALSAEERRSLLADHAERARAAAKTPDVDERARAAEAELQQAIANAQRARSEAERLVSEEYVRLLGVETRQVEFEKKLAVGQRGIDEEREATLGWQRRAREARSGQVKAEVVDRTHDELRTTLRAARDELDRALASATDGKSDVPAPGPDPLDDLQSKVDARAAREKRAQVEATAARLRQDEAAFHDARASQLLDEINALNAERLALLPFLSPAKRAAVTGFTAEGADQAAQEVRQLTLIARYHRYAAARWIHSAREDRRVLGLGVGATVLVVIEWIVALAAFFWVRRRLPIGLQTMLKRSRADDRHERRTTPSLATHAIAFALRVHRPILWFGLSVALTRLLPSSARGLLEVQLISLIADWIIGGALVVVTVNALAASGADDGDGTAALRLRSLRLVGRVVVVFGLVLVLTAKLVGAGTIYEWVFSTCWFASIPVFLVLVRWWRKTVFERAGRARRKSAFERWVLDHTSGWKSLVAAMAGGLFLFVRGAVRVLRGWIGRFRLTRTVLAYLFRRELDKLEASREEVTSARIADEAFDALGPDRPSEALVATDADEALARIGERVELRHGGIVAVVGAYGMGKTTLLGRLREKFPEAAHLQVPIAPERTFVRDAAPASAAGLVIVDDAQRLVRPIMGGLSAFDELLDIAAAQPSVTWVLAFDEILWLFLQRARGSRPLFEDVIRLSPWREEQIVELLCARTEATGLAPTFENLLDRLPASADEIDKQEALHERAMSYYRLLWDYAEGNPAVALHMWRRALGSEPDGLIHVRFFQAPNAADLEALPDQTVFVLRAVLQLEEATAAEIAEATMLQTADIADALRYARARTFIVLVGARYAITWTWRRAISVFLQRRHLLVRS